MKFNQSGSSDSLDSCSEQFNQDCSLANALPHNVENETPLSQPINIVPTQSKFDNVALNNTSNVTFGNKTFYNGPVTINQFQVNSTSGDKDSSVGAENGSTSRSNSENFQSRTNENNEKTWSLKSCTGRRKLLIFIIIFIVIIVVTLAIALSITLNSTSVPISNQSDYSTENPDEGRGNNSSDPPRIISRQEWLAKPPKNPLADLDIPVAKVIISHTAGGNCFDQKGCIFIIQNIQNYHMEDRGFDDIGFNFLIGGDGLVYEGRGWNKRGTHTQRHNNQSIGLSFIGDFTEFLPQAKQIDAAKYILEEGLEKKKLTLDYCLYAQMQLIATKSPGLPLYQLIRKWPHWCNTYT